MSSEVIVKKMVDRDVAQGLSDSGSRDELLTRLADEFASEAFCNGEGCKPHRFVGLESNQVSPFSPEKHILTLKYEVVSE